MNVKGAYTISDTVIPIEITKGDKKFLIPRYGVWSRFTGDVVEVSDDLEYLLKKYNLTPEDVKKIR